MTGPLKEEPKNKCCKKCKAEWEKHLKYWEQIETLSKGLFTRNLFGKVAEEQFCICSCHQPEPKNQESEWNK